MHKQTSKPSGGAFDCRLVGCVQEPIADEASERFIGNGWLQIGRGLEHPGGKGRTRSGRLSESGEREALNARGRLLLGCAPPESGRLPDHLFAGPSKIRGF